MCLIFFSCGMPAPPTLMPVGLQLVHTEAGGGSRATLGMCVHERRGGSAHQAAAHQDQVSLASWWSLAELKVHTFGLLLKLQPKWV